MNAAKVGQVGVYRNQRQTLGESKQNFRRKQTKKQVQQGAKAMCGWWRDRGSWLEMRADVKTDGQGGIWDGWWRKSCGMKTQKKLK